MMNRAKKDKRAGFSQVPPFQQRLVFTGVVFVCILILMIVGLSGISERIEARQTEFLEQCVERSAIQCYVIEGRFPTSEEGVAYLKEHYGLQIDEQRYVVYYESIADNMLPQVKVILLDPQTPVERINRSLGFSQDGLFPSGVDSDKSEP